MKKKTFRGFVKKDFKIYWQKRTKDEYPNEGLAGIKGLYSRGPLSKEKAGEYVKPVKITVEDL